MAVIVPGTPSSFHAPSINTTAYLNGRKVYYTANMENVEGILDVQHGGTGNRSFKDGEVVIYSGGKFISAGISNHELAVLAGIAGSLSGGGNSSTTTKVTVYVLPDGSYYQKSETGDGYDHRSPLGDLIESGITKEEVDEKISSGAVTETEKNTGDDVKTVYKDENGNYYEKSETGPGYDYKSPLGDVIQSGVTKGELEEKISSGDVTPEEKRTDEDVKTVYKTPEGNYYEKSETGDGYDYKSPLGDIIQSGVTKEELENIIASGGASEAEKNTSDDVKTIYTAPDGSYYEKSETGDGYVHKDPLGDIIEDNISKTDMEQLIYGGTMTEGERPTGENVKIVYALPDGSYYEKSKDGNTYTYYDKNGNVVRTDIGKDEVLEKVTGGEAQPSPKYDFTEVKSLAERLNEKIGAIKTASGVPLDKEKGTDVVVLPDYLLKTGGEVKGNLQVQGKFSVGNVSISADPITNCISFGPLE